MQPSKSGYGLVYRDFMRNPLLTIEAKAIFNYLVSFAGQNDKCYPGKELMLSELNVSEQRFDKHMKLLVDNGFVIKDRLRKNGKLSNNIYKIEAFPTNFLGTDTPYLENQGIENQCIENQGIENQCMENQGIENQCMENQGHNNNSINNNSINNKYIDYFNKFWGAYPKKVSKTTAEKSFKKLKVDDELLIKMINSLEVHKQSKQWQDKQYIPNPSTWLNQKRWEDEIENVPKDERVTITAEGTFKF